jgi:lipid II:glycine glycyltransferase (peptidoglycan interpeptide bridge formation enzyme)
MNNLDKIATHPLQTSFWEEFRREWGNGVVETKYGILTLHKIPYTKFKIAMFEKGPAPTKSMLSDLKKIGRENNLIFIKLEPNCLKSDKLIKLMQSEGAAQGRRLFTPTTFWIDLTPSEENLLKSFSSKTRYNIKLAERKEVTVEEDNSDNAFNKYLDLTRETIRRQGFYAHSEKYHRLMWNILKKAGIAHLLTATYQGEIITTWILFTWKKFLYYPYGASTEKHKEVMANNLMMWEAIKFGKKMGLTTFDLWGREEGKGFTKFKEGYNPKVIEFLGSWDLIINMPAYLIYRLEEKIRWPALKVAASFGLSKHRF